MNREAVKEECTEYSGDDDDDDDAVQEMSRDVCSLADDKCMDIPATGHRDRAFSTDYKSNVHVGSSRDMQQCALTDVS